MIVNYKQIIKYSKDKKIETVDLEPIDKDPKFCCKGIESLLSLGVITFDSKGELKDKSLLVGFKINHEGKPKTIEINHCPNCGEKIETKLLNTEEYDLR